MKDEWGRSWTMRRWRLDDQRSRPGHTALTVGDIREGHAWPVGARRQLARRGVECERDCHAIYVCHAKGRADCEPGWRANCIPYCAGRCAQTVLEEGGENGPPLGPENVRPVSGVMTNEGRGRLAGFGRRPRRNRKHRRRGEQSIEWSWPYDHHKGVLKRVRERLESTSPPESARRAVS